MKSFNEIKSINTVLEQFANTYELQNEYIFSRILQIWNEKFPDTIRNNIKLLRFTDGVLYMFSDSTAWRKEILLRNSELIFQLNSHFETEIITKICIK